MKKLFTILLAAAMLFALGACGSDAAVDPTGESAAQTPVPEQTMEPEAEVSDAGKTVASQLTEAFVAEMERTDSNVDEVVWALMEHEAVGTSMDSMDVTDTMLNGFSEEIPEYISGRMIAPIIGSIPFVSYIFEVDDGQAEEFADALRDKAMLNWNICTVADEMQTAVYGNYVYFVMAPFSFDT